MLQKSGNPVVGKGIGEKFHWRDQTPFFLPLLLA